MPRGDGTGPWGAGPLSHGRGSCQRMGFGNGFGRGRQSGFSFSTNTASLAPETMEAQAERLETQAANLRNLAKQNRKTE